MTNFSVFSIFRNFAYYSGTNSGLGMFLDNVD